MPEFKKSVIVGEHTIVLPDFPKDKSQILFVDEKPKNAYWRRITDYPKIFFEFIPYFTKVDTDATLYDEDGNLSQINKEDSNIVRRIYEQEMYRRLHGVWFRNGEEFEYITGDHYLILQWVKMYGVEGGYGAFWKFQRDVGYLIMHVKKNPDILGLYLTKSKKTGITQFMCGYYLNKSTMTKEQQMGIMSKKGDDAIDTNMMFYLHGLDNLPMAFKPRWSTRADREGVISFSERAYRGKEIQKSKSSEDYLNTKVYCVPTKEAAFDSPLMHDVWFDELTKSWKESKKSPAQIFNTNKETVKLQTKFNGRVWITQYPNEETDIGFEEGREIYFDSKLSTMEYGRTKTGLICHHIPAYYSHTDCMDKLGNCAETEAYNLNMRERNRQKKDKNAYQAAIRQYSNDEKECWGSAGSTTTYDIIRLGNLKYKLEDDLRSLPTNPYLAGKLVWENTLWEVGKKDKRPSGVFCNVRFVPLTAEEIINGEEGRIKIFHGISDFERNAALKFGRDDLGNLIAPERFTFVGGTDPTKYSDVGQVAEGSKLASYTMNIFDAIKDIQMRQVASRIIYSEYHYRPELAAEGYEDMLKEIIYFGKLVIIESNAEYISTRLMSEGLGNYMLVKNKDGIIDRWTTSMDKNEWKFIKMTANQTNTGLLETLIELTKKYLLESTDGEPDYGTTIKSPKLLEQFMNFDPSDTKKSDLAMAFGYALLAMESYLALLLKPQNEYYNPMNVLSVLQALKK